MPCDTVRTSRVELRLDATDLGLLKKALESLGYEANVGNKLVTFNDKTFNVRGEYNITSGRLTAETIGNTRFDLNAVKRAYSEQVVNQQAEQMGWEISWSTNEQGEREFEVQRRSL